MSELEVNVKVTMALGMGTQPKLLSFAKKMSCVT